MTDNSAPVYHIKCKFCQEVDIVLTYEKIHNMNTGFRRKWICRNASDGQIHDCQRGPST